MVTQSSTHPKALVVAGDTDILQLVSAILKHENFKFVSAPCHEEGYVLAQSEEPDVIIFLADKNDTCDLFCEQVRGNQKISEIPLVVLTTSGNSQTYARFFANGCDQVLPVPFKCSQLFEVIHKATERKSFQGESKIRVLYRSGQAEFVSPAQLNDLLATKELLCFQRKDGIASIGRDPVRCFARADYQGPERRRSEA
jgi:DNA-binding response OmpR family regulator